MILNRSRIQQAKCQPTAKTNLTNSENDLLRELLVATNEDYNFIKDNYSVYETCLLLESKQNSIGNKGKTLTTTYNQGDILMVDLGINIYGHEFSYEHPCGVMLNQRTKVFVIPCTSQKARKDKKGNIREEYVKALQSDGFAKKTTLLLTEAKFIDKTRIKAKLRKIKKDKFIELEDKLFSILLPYKKYALEKVRKDIVTLEDEKNTLIN
ncbi:type II toxin-antitoxin system PemK/MazF family toxin [Clostridium perfringens]|nr:type II toxin-antitoxin system PemK/MazF family toxin [Clostridium perfringens]